MGMIKLPKKSINFYKENIDEIFDSGMLAEGKWNKQLSSFVKDLASSKYAVPTSSNGSGLICLLQLYNYYYKRKNVLIQSNTMYGVKVMVPAGSCKLSGFISCRLETLMPSIGDVKRSVQNFSTKDKAELIIMLSHIGGIINPDMQEIADFCKAENIILIEDCAHSFGTSLNGKSSGLFGDAGVYSFYSTKAIPAGEGGIIVTNDDEIGQMSADYSIYDRFNQKLEIGFNNRISEPQALLSYSVVKEWQNILDNKVSIAEKYMNVCKELGLKYIPQNEDGQIGNYYKFIIYDANTPAAMYLPKLKTKTSPVYDYSIGVKNPLADYHTCLPIWYGQEEEITFKVIEELNESIALK